MRCLACSQVVAPFLFDQFFWAEKVPWLGLGPPPLSRDKELQPRITVADDAAAGDARVGPAAAAGSPVTADGLRRLDAAVTSVTRALATACGPLVRKACRAFAAKLKVEEGTRVAVKVSKATACVPRSTRERRCAPHTPRPVTFACTNSTFWIMYRTGAAHCMTQVQAAAAAVAVSNEERVLAVAL